MILLAYAGGIFTGLCIAVLVGAYISRREKNTGEKETSQLFHHMEQAFGNVMYKTEGSTILTVRIGQYDDERHEDYLMKTPNGRYFHQSHQRFTGGSQYDYIHPYTKEEAMRDYNHTPDKRVSFEEAFGEGLIEA